MNITYMPQNLSFCNLFFGYVTHLSLHSHFCKDCNIESTHRSRLIFHTFCEI